MSEDKRKGLTIDVSITDTEVFREFLGVVSKIVTDRRMPDGLRNDAMIWLNDISASAATLVSAGLTQEHIVVLCGASYQGKVLWEEIKHKYSPNARVWFIGTRGNVDGLRPDKVVRVYGWEESVGVGMTWFTRDGYKPEVIDETGDNK